MRIVQESWLRHSVLPVVLAMALSAAACNADAEPTTTTLSCDAYGDEWASGIEEAASLHVEGLAAIEQWGAGELSQGELASITDDLYLEYFGLIERLGDIGPPPEGMETTIQLARDAISALFQGYGLASRGLDDDLDEATIEEANQQLNEGAKLLSATVEACEECLSTR